MFWPWMTFKRKKSVEMDAASEETRVASTILKERLNRLEALVQEMKEERGAKKNA